MTQSAPIVDYSPAGSQGSVWTQTWGLLVDAYRDLHAKKLFWITLVISLLVVLSFAFVGINQVGITILKWEIPGAWNTNFIPRESFYKSMFTSLAIPYWLGVCASVLALISVAGIFPDLLTGGSIDLYLSKPISRLRLFFSKYLFGLMFVALQVFVFCAASFLVMGVRGGTWEPGVFLAVPIVTLFFSYLFSVCVLLGIITRSTLVAILLTALLWFGLWMFNSADDVLLAFKTAAHQEVASTRRLVATNEQIIAKNNELPENQRGNLSQWEFQRDRQKERLAKSERTAEQLEFWHKLIVAIKTPLPKTSDTVRLLERWLVDPDPFFAASEESHAKRQARRAQRAPSTTRSSPDLEDFIELPETERQITTEIRSRPLVWVLGTSLGFEAVILAIAGWIFCRRDF